ncbi:Dyp-type peroxidase [Longispora albida]|uniref:Dyp-type peroxidase n=1 Tax=Longispora albida TaxID=203523 RepID=UPI00036DCEFD|nr:Dyp-type peroxidase [Longispora albida]
MSQDPELAEEPEPVGFGRRRVLGLVAGGAATAGAGLGAGAAALVQNEQSPEPQRPGRAWETVRGTGPGQPGIAEAPPAHLRLLAFDLEPAAAKAALTAWTNLAAELAAGQADLGLAPAALTVTAGLGQSLFAKLGRPVPGQLTMPSFAGDRLEEQRGGGDVLLQVCAEDPMVVAFAAEKLRRVPGTRLRWQQSGFRPTAAASVNPAATARNLMGQLDGTANPAPGSGLFDSAVWAQPSGTTFLVYRRIRMLLGTWHDTPPAVRERVIGRRLTDGAPLTGKAESDPPELNRRDAGGEYVIAADAHIRLANPGVNRGARMLRRGYSYDDGPEDAGLVFLAFQADPRTAFVPVQERLAASDALNRFTVHTGSGVYLVPPASGTCVGAAVLGL